MKDYFGYCNMMPLLQSDKLIDFDFRCRLFQQLLQRQYDWMDDENQTILKIMYRYNSQLLNNNWEVELVQQLGGKADINEQVALLELFYGKPEKIKFDSNGFKLLWQKEKDINIDMLIYMMTNKPELIMIVIVAVLDAEQYFYEESS